MFFVDCSTNVTSVESGNVKGGGKGERVPPPPKAGGRGPSKAAGYLGKLPLRPEKDDGCGRMSSRMKTILPWRWCNTSHKWVEDRDPPETSVPQSFATMSYNVWFQGARDGDEARFERQWIPRQRALLSVCRHADVDVFCFQEVTTPETCQRSFMELLLEEDWVRDGYWVSDVTGQNTFTTWYGVMIISRLPVKSFSFAPFPNSKMGRCLLVAHLNTLSGHEKIAIGSVHLESLNNASKRREQLKASLEFLEQTSQIGLLLGDFNVGGSAEKRQCSQDWSSRGWKDVDPGASSWFAGGWRPDHTLLRSSQFNGDSIVVGDKPYGGEVIGFDGIVTTPSDHYAIRSHFTMNACVGKSVGMTQSPCSYPIHLEHPHPRWSLANTRAVATAPSHQVFAGTQAPTEAVEMLNKDASLWPNLLGLCYVWSTYKGKWYLMWPGDAKEPVKISAPFRKEEAKVWSLANLASSKPEDVNQNLVFKGAQSATDAIEMLNADQASWPNLIGQCHVWSAHDDAWYHMWAASS